MSDKHDQIYKQAREAYGLEFEVGMLQEECAEIIVACSKLLRFPEPGNVKKLFEEIADAENLFEQMKRWFPDMREYVDKIRSQKLDRLGERIKEGQR